MCLSFTASNAKTVGPMALIFCMSTNLVFERTLFGNQGQRSKVKVRNLEKCVFLNYFPPKGVSNGEVGINGYFWQLANFCWQPAKSHRTT